MEAIDKPAIENLLILRGSTFGHAFRLENPDGTPIDLSGYTARMQIRRSINSATILLELTEGNGRIEFDSINGRITLKIASDITAGLAFSGRYDLEIVLPVIAGPDVVYRIAEGKIILSKEVTR